MKNGSARVIISIILFLVPVLIFTKKVSDGYYVYSTYVPDTKTVNEPIGFIVGIFLVGLYNYIIINSSKKEENEEKLHKQNEIIVQRSAFEKDLEIYISQEELPAIQNWSLSNIKIGNGDDIKGFVYSTDEMLYIFLDMNSSKEERVLQIRKGSILKYNFKVMSGLNSINIVDFSFLDGEIKRIIINSKDLSNLRVFFKDA